MTDEEKTKLEKVLAAVQAKLGITAAEAEIIEDQAPEGDAKADALKDNADRIASLEETVKELTEQLTKPDYSSIDAEVDPDAVEELIDESGQPKHSFKSMGDFTSQIYTQGPNGAKASDEMKRWQGESAEYIKATQTVGAAETGGTLVPIEYASAALERARTESYIYANAVKIPMGTQTIDMPYIESFNERDGRVDGNVEWLWKGEEAQLTARNFESGVVSLRLNKCTGFCKVTDELLKFSPQSIETLVSNSFNRGLIRAINRSCLRGTGAGQPRGVIGAPCTIDVPKATGQVADTFVYRNVLDMTARLYADDDNGIGEGAWFANKTVLPQVGLLNVAVGTGGYGIFLANNSIQGKPEMSLLGIPLKWSSLCGKVGDSGDIGLYNWAKYLIGHPAGGEGMEVASSIHFYFDYASTAYRFIFYMDGQPWWPTEFVPEYGDSQSPFLTLADRA